MASKFKSTSSITFVNMIYQTGHRNNMHRALAITYYVIIENDI